MVKRITHEDVYGPSLLIDHVTLDHETEHAQIFTIHLTEEAKRMLTVDTKPKNALTRQVVQPPSWIDRAVVSTGAVGGVVLALGLALAMVGSAVFVVETVIDELVPDSHVLNPVALHALHGIVHELSKPIPRAVDVPPISTYGYASGTTITRPTTIEPTPITFTENTTFTIHGRIIIIGKCGKFVIDPDKLQHPAYIENPKGCQ